MSVRWPIWGAMGGAVVALAVLAGLSFILLESGGANYKVLVAVWLWLLPVTGFLAVLGYAAGRMIDAATGATTSGEDGSEHADPR